MKILDTTIRDGSYTVDFQFSCSNVREIAEKVERLGIEYIEIGHGMGLNASSSEHGIALHSYLEYMKAVQGMNSKMGFFCIPGIARMEDLEVARENHMEFVRVGVNANQPQKAKEYIQTAKELGLTVMTNYMKSYTVEPERFAESACIAHSYGADYVYLVDSAGCMLPKQIKEYYDETRKVSDVLLGFHGHNNLGLAVSNTVYCAELGFDMLDCSIQGLGRSLGNASLEQVVMVLEKMGYDLGIDIPRLLEYGYSSLHDIVDKELANPLELICGYADFHSGFIKDIYKCCMEKKVDPLRLIIAYCNENKESMNWERLLEIAETLPIDNEKNPYRFIFEKNGLDD